MPCAGASLFQPVHYSDVGHAIYVSFCKIVDGIFSFPASLNVVGPSRASLFDIVSLVKSLSLSRSRVLLLPAGITKLLAALLALFPCNSFLPVTSEQLLRLSEDKVFDDDWTAIDPTHKPIDLVSGLNALIEEMYDYS